jgi:hypothetical protein
MKVRCSVVVLVLMGMLFSATAHEGEFIEYQLAVINAGGVAEKGTCKKNHQ